MLNGIAPWQPPHMDARCLAQTSGFSTAQELVTFAAFALFRTVRGLGKGPWSATAALTIFRWSLLVWMSLAAVAVNLVLPRSSSRGHTCTKCFRPFASHGGFRPVEGCRKSLGRL